MEAQRNWKKRPFSYRKSFVPIMVALLWILLWEGLSLWVDQELLVPSPIQVIQRIVQLVQTASFWQIAATTVFRITSGFVFGTVLGVLFAVITSASPVIYAFFKPLLSIIKATPVASFIILALVWIKGGQIPGFISFLMVFPIIWGNVVKGIAETDPKLLEMAKVYHVKKSEIVKKIFVNSVLPYFIPAVTTSMGLAWKAGIAAEVITTPAFAIGTAIYDSKLYLETIDLFAWSIVIIVISVILEKIMVVILNRLLPDKAEACQEEQQIRTKGGRI